MKKIFIFTLPLIIIGAITVMFLLRDEVKPEKSIANSPDALFIEGNRYFYEGKYRDAIRAYQDVRHSYPTSAKAPEALYQIGKSYEHLRLYLEAAAVYETFLEFYPQDPLILQVKLDKAAMDMNVGQLEETKDELLEIIKQDMTPVISSRAKNLLANCYFKLKDYKSAQKYYEMVSSPSLSYLRKHQQEFLQMGEVYMAAKEFSKARQVLLRLINIFPRSEFSDQALTILGDSFHAEGELEKALLIYAHTAKSYPLREWGQRCRLRLADLGLERDRSQLKDLKFSHTDYLDPSSAYRDVAEKSIYPELSAFALWKLGALFHQKGNYKEAYAAFKNIENNYIGSRYDKDAQSSAQELMKKLVDSFYEQNDFLSVVNFYRKNPAEIERESDPLFLFQVASSCQNMGLYTLAINIYKQAAQCSRKVDGLGQGILLNLGESYNQDEKYDLAEKLIRDFLHKQGKKNKSCRAYPILIEALYQQEKFHEAIHTYIRSLKLCPKNKNNLYVNYLIGISYQKTGNISQARAFFKQVLQLAAPPKSKDDDKVIPLSSNLPLQVGNILYDLKDYDTAAEVYSRTLKMPKTKDITPWAIYQLARSYQKQGLDKEARKAYKELLSHTNDPFWKDLVGVWLD